MQNGPRSSRAGVRWEAKGGDRFRHPLPLKADYRLQNLNVLCQPTLRAFGYVELNRLAFLKSAEAVRLNRCVVHKNVLTICTAQKAEPLGIVEPLHCTLFHCFFLSNEMTLNSIGDLQVVRTPEAERAENQNRIRRSFRIYRRYDKCNEKFARIAKKMPCFAYSYFSDSTGSIRAALTAGNVPKATPTAHETRMAITADSHETCSR